MSSVIYSDFVYSCVKCADCCGPWEIPISKIERDEIAKIFPGKKFTRKGHSSYLIIEKKANNYCVFLDESNLCKIHSKRGEIHKPLACRIYPFEFCRWDDGITTIYCRMDCRGTTFRSFNDKKKAKLIFPHFENEIQKSKIISADKYSKSLTLDTKRIRIITEAYQQIIEHKHGSLGQKLLAFSELLDFHSKKENQCDLINARKEFINDAVALYERSLENLDSKIRSSPKLDLPSKIFLKQLISGFIRRDEDFSLLSRLKKAFSITSFCLEIQKINALGNNYLSHSQKINKCSITDETSIFITKFIASRLKTMHFIAKTCLNLPFEDGIKHLISASLSAIWIAKSFHLDDPMIPLRIVDHNFSSSKFFLMPQVKFCRDYLCQPQKLSSILKSLLENC